jgi:Mg/Co/Ni transporter MgtE
MLLTIPFGILNLILAPFLVINFGFIGAIYSLMIITTLNGDLKN